MVWIEAKRSLQHVKLFPICAARRPRCCILRWEDTCTLDCAVSSIESSLTLPVTSQTAARSPESIPHFTTCCCCCPGQSRVAVLRSNAASKASFKLFLFFHEQHSNGIGLTHNWNHILLAFMKCFYSLFNWTSVSLQRGVPRAWAKCSISMPKISCHLSKCHQNPLSQPIVFANVELKETNVCLVTYPLGQAQPFDRSVIKHSSASQIPCLKLDSGNNNNNVDTEWIVHNHER